MKRLVIVLLIGAIVIWSWHHWNQLNRRSDDFFTYASDNPEKFWAGLGVFALIVAVSIFGSRRR